MHPAERRVFITGAARRLGRALAVYLARKGFDVIAHYHRSEKEARALQAETSCSLFKADFTSIRVEDLRSRLQKEIGFVDILINNASSFHRGSWEELGEEAWDRELSVNLKIPFFLTQYFGKQMKERGAGKIISIADIAAKRPYLRYLPYSLAKAGVVSFTKAMARALAPQVQVNAVAPGTILFPDDFTEEEKRQLTAEIPARRTGTVEELLYTVDFLLSDADYITGQTIVLDGGRSLKW